MLKSMRNLFLILSLAALLAGAVPDIIAAQTAPANQQALLDQIKALLTQIQNLQNALNQQQAQEPQAVTRVSYIVSPLEQGDSGDSVKILQALLAADPAVYPEALVTGFYGSLTAAAVRRFQAKNGIETAGVVGPRTRAKLDEVLAANSLGLEAAPAGRRPCAIVAPGHLIASGWLGKNAEPVVPECQTLPPGITPKLEEPGPAATSTPAITTPTSTPAAATSTPVLDTVAPLILGLTTQNVSTGAATIVWTTDEPATTRMYYATEAAPIAANTVVNGTPVPSQPAASSSSLFPWNYSVMDSSLTKSHAVGLSGLNSSTRYYYVVESKDASGNAASSTSRAFLTAAPPSVALLVTSQTIDPSTSSAKILWTTNVMSDSQITYGTSLSYGLTTPLDTTLVTTHSQTLTGLAPNTPYYYQISSRDSFGTLTTAAGQFTTHQAGD
ncbi:MAG: peptidoglycan-binding protein [Candidatus Liptonbacteria bacterium]|nr:peptidoglycan-binding protein [Candidatus Liptonbacteria bacterium]